MFLEAEPGVLCVWLMRLDELKHRESRWTSTLTAFPVCLPAEAPDLGLLRPARFDHCLEEPNLIWQWGRGQKLGYF